MKKKLWIVSIIAVAEFALCAVLLLGNIFFMKAGEQTIEPAFTEISADGRFELTGEYLYSGLGVFALFGPRTLSVSVRDSAVEGQRSSVRHLMTVRVSDDGGGGTSAVTWTNDGFSLRLEGSEQDPITYTFYWKDIFPYYEN
ncbi:MAG: hypothetical protein LBS36_07145 [Oscillospiraceae bacterium]|jgi:hypothetical protein|nr:hypothetical protein [Oscillospiraceae bacterium]